MKKFLHIGYPKSLSTSLQRSFFSKHKEISYLGIGRGGDISYLDPIVHSFFENDIKYCRKYAFEKKQKRICSHFEKLFSKSEHAGFQAIGASSEHLCAAVTMDNIETLEKAERLREVFGSDTAIIAIIRNQADLIKSLYREGVRIGYSGTFDEYVRFLYLFKERNFITDLYYNEVLQSYSKVFGRKNIHLFFYETYVDSKKGLGSVSDTKGLVEDLQSVLGLSDLVSDLEHKNQSIPPLELERKRHLNRRIRHDIGNQLWNGAENHRLGVYWNYELDARLSEAEIFTDVLTKQALLREVKCGSDGSDYTKHKTYQLSELGQLYWERLMASFKRVNQCLLEDWISRPTDLPSEYSFD